MKISPGDIIRKLLSPGPYVVLGVEKGSNGVNIKCRHLRGGDLQHFMGYYHTPCGRLVYPAPCAYPGELYDEVFIVEQHHPQLALFEGAA